MIKKNSPTVRAPRVAGGMLRVLTPLVEHPPLGAAITRKLLSDIGILDLRRLEPGESLPFRPPLEPGPGAEPARSRSEAGAPDDAQPPAPRSGEGFLPESSTQLVRDYREKRTDPVRVAERVITWHEELEKMSPPLRALVAQNREDLLAQAESSHERYQRTRPLSSLDGVPVAVKDELDLAGYPTGVGTRFMAGAPAKKDATVVARLRAAGALLIGKANMHEIGLGVTGINPHHGPARNPYDPARITGGSSSGPAAAVACGLVPIAVGADGGGSIRIPAALCGVVGLKPTFGRMSEKGAAPLCWSVAHVGPIAATASDCALAYLRMAGPDPDDAQTAGQPQVHLDRFSENNLYGIRLGYMPEWFEQADAQVVENCRGMLSGLRQAGAEVKEIYIAGLELVRPVHLVIIVSEMAAAHLGYYRRQRRRYGHDTRMNLALARRLRAFDYIQAQRLRLSICRNFQEALAQVDAIVTPATGCTAAEIRTDALRTGESDLALTERIMRFAPAANLTGLPAICFPAGYDSGGLPVGLQVMGRAFEEHLLLRIARVAEAHCPRRQPKMV